jgi:phospholipase/carboxylesterase
MNLIQSTLIHKILPPRRQSAGKPPALILLHGRGADEDDLLGLSEYLDERLFIISARAPFDFQFGTGYTWYDILEIGRPEAKMFTESYEKLVQFLEDVKKGYPIDPSKIFFGGFSMGTMMSYAIALTYPDNVAGVIANSGYIPEETDLKFQWEKIKGKPFFIAHGTFDPLIPVMFSRRAKALLEQAQAAVWYREYDMAHQISEESLNDIMNWLSQHL